MIQDQLYSRALALAEQIQTANIHLVISSYVFLEIVTVLSQRRGRSLACVAGQNLQIHPGMRIIHIDERLYQQTWELFQKIDNKNISFVDCSTLVILQAEHISRLLTFDRTDFAKLKRYQRFSLYTGTDVSN